MRCAINNVHAVYSSFGEIRKEFVLLTCDVPCPEKILHILIQCSQNNINESVKLMSELYQSGHSPQDIIDTIFKICKDKNTFIVSEPVRYEIIIIKQTMESKYQTIDNLIKKLEETNNLNKEFSNENSSLKSENRKLNVSNNGFIQDIQILKDEREELENMLKKCRKRNYTRPTVSWINGTTVNTTRNECSEEK